MAPLAGTDLTRSQYGRALVALQGLHAHIEPLILAFLDQHPGLFDYRPRTKLEALNQDLETLGLAPAHPATGPAAPTCVGQLTGLLYTVEGATLGGKFLAERIRARHGTALPLRFLAAYGEATEARWQAFWQFADQLGADRHAAAIGAAQAAFAAYRDHFDSFQAMPD